MTGSAAPDVLATIVAATRRTVEERRARTDRRTLEAQAGPRQPDGRAFAAALVAARTDAAGRPLPNVIAECKRRSPSKGVLREAYDAAAVARAYESAGAAAISVLTEPCFFDGALDHLRAVGRAVGTPLLRKDFTVDEYQLAEAQACGADAVLLIVAALTDAELERLHEAAARGGFAVVVEVHTADEMRRAVDAGARIIGVNSRNLKTLGVSLDVTLELAAMIPRDVIAVAESGIRSRADIDTLARGGYHAFLVGERLVTQPDPGAALAGLMGPS